MAFYDVEALLDATAKQDEKMEDAPPAQVATATSANGDDPSRLNGGSTGDTRSRDKSRERDRDRDGDRSKDRKRRGERDRENSRDHYSSRRGTPDSERTPRSDAGSHRSSRRRSRSRDRYRGEDRHSRRNRDGDFYRGGRGVGGGGGGGGYGRSRSRSPSGRYYRPRDDRRDYRDRRDRRDDDRRGGRTPRADRGEREPTPPSLTEDERDRRTVFVQQLAARLRTKDLKEFFEKVGPVSEAQIVKDRVSNRSKGYVQASYLHVVPRSVESKC